jgi:hypothetical protein
MAASTYKGYELIVTGTEEDTWGAVLNSDVFSRIDANLGGLVSKTLSNIAVILTADENRNLILRLEGLLTGNVLITSTLQGMMFVENLTTGAFAVTFTNGFGSPITLPQGVRSLVIADTTNGARSAASNAPAVPSGTRMLFQQTTAPTGWTKDVAAGLNNKALRLVNGAVGSGGTVAFTDAFKSQAVAGTVGGTALTVAQLPAHTHRLQNSAGGSFTDPLNPGSNGFASLDAATGYLTTSDSAWFAELTGNGDTHSHSFTGTAINLAVAYVDLIVAVKD